MKLGLLGQNVTITMLAKHQLSHSTKQAFTYFIKVVTSNSFQLFFKLILILFKVRSMVSFKIENKIFITLYFQQFKFE